MGSEAFQAQTSISRVHLDSPSSLITAAAALSSQPVPQELETPSNQAGSFLSTSHTGDLGEDVARAHCAALTWKTGHRAWVSLRPRVGMVLAPGDSPDVSDMMAIWAWRSSSDVPGQR